MVTDPAVSLLASLVLEDDRRWGDAAVDEQWDDARGVLDQTGPPYHFLTRARGYSKTSDLGGIAIAVMLEQLPPGSRLYGLASDKDQGRLLSDAIAGFSARTPGLAGAITCDAYKVTAANGSVLEILPVAGAWGLRPAFLIVDELAQWTSTTGPRKLWEATTSALTKVSSQRRPSTPVPTCRRCSVSVGPGGADARRGLRAGAPVSVPRGLPPTRARGGAP